MIGAAAPLADVPSRLKLHRTIQTRGMSGRVLGRWRLAYDGGGWDVWTVEFDGVLQWVQEDEGELTLFDERLSTTAPASALCVGAEVTVGPHALFVQERGEGTVRGARGEVDTAWPPRTPFRYAAGSIAGRVATVLVAASETLLFVGTPADDLVCA